MPQISPNRITSREERRQLSRKEFIKESLICIFSFLSISGILVIIFFFLPNVYTMYDIIRKTNRFADLHHVFICMQFVCAFISSFVNILSAWFCWKTKLLPRMISFLLIADSIARSLGSILLVVGFYCQFPAFIPSTTCIGFPMEPIYKYAQAIFGPFLYISGYLQIALSLNRFFALSYRGYYYHRVQKYHWFQVGVPCALGVVSWQWIDQFVDVRIVLVSATIPLDFILIYKMARTKRDVDYANGRFLLAQVNFVGQFEFLVAFQECLKCLSFLFHSKKNIFFTVKITLKNALNFFSILANNVPLTLRHIVFPFIWLITINDWPLVTDILYYFANLFVYSGSQLYQGMVTIYLLCRDGKKFGHSMGNSFSTRSN